jgi:hypothetical protein
MANPNVEEVLNEVAAAIEHASDLPIDGAAIDRYKNRYRKSFTDRLLDPADPNSWRHARKNVLNAAAQSGILAAAIARLNRVNRVEWIALKKASNIVENECHINYQQGAWCS